MSDKIIQMADIRNDNKLITPEAALRDAAEAIASGKRKCNKVLILCLDDDGNGYDTGFYAANLKCSEILGLLSRFQHTFNKLITGE